MVEEILDSVQKYLHRYKWEIFIEERETLSVYSKELKVEKISKAKDVGFCVRVEKDKKVGFAYGTVLSPEGIKNTIKMALDTSIVSDEGELLLQTPKPPGGEEYFDEFSFKELPQEAKIQKAIDLEETAYRLDSRVKGVRDANFSETAVRKILLNSEGLNITQRGTVYTGSIGILAEDKKDSQISWGYTASRYLEDLDIEKMVKETVYKATSLLGARPIKTQKLPVLFPSYAMAEMLSQFFPMFSGEFYIKGKAVLKEFLGKRLFPDYLSIIDSGVLKKGVGSFPYDDEGTPSQETVIVGNGTFLNFLHNLYTGKYSNRKSTGNGKRTFKTTPQVGYTNLFIDKTHIDINKELTNKTYFYVFDLIGLHTSDVVTGDFSIGATGILFVRGEPVQGVKEVTVAGNFIEVLKNIEIIGNDLTFYGSVGSPSVLVKELMIGGY